MCTLLLDCLSLSHGCFPHEKITSEHHVLSDTVRGYMYMYVMCACDCVCHAWKCVSVLIVCIFMYVCVCMYMPYVKVCVRKCVCVCYVCVNVCACVLRVCVCMHNNHMTRKAVRTGRGRNCTNWAVMTQDLNSNLLGIMYPRWLHCYLTKRNIGLWPDPHTSRSGLALPD